MWLENFVICLPTKLVRLVDWFYKVQEENSPKKEMRQDRRNKNKKHAREQA